MLGKPGMVGKGQAGRWEEQERVVSWRPVVMTTSAGPGTQEILAGGLSIIPEGLGASPFPSLDLSFPSVTWDG